MTLTVIIRDESRFLHMQEPVMHRSVRIELTEEQAKALELRARGEFNGQEIREEISHCFIEPEMLF